MELLLKLVTSVFKWLVHYRWRRRIRDLIHGGLKIGKNVVVDPTVYIDQASPFLIEIGDNCAIAHGVRILSHDATPFKFIGGYTRLGKVHIKDNCFIAENCIILPGVTIGPNVLVAAGSVVNKDIPPNSCVAGVPARFYAKFEDMLDRHREGIKNRSVFPRADLYFGPNAAKTQQKCREAVEEGDAYVQGFPGVYPFTVNPMPLQPDSQADG